MPLCPSSTWTMKVTSHILDFEGGREGLSEPLSVYLHVPFCRSKCPYCSFASSVPRLGDVDLYLSALESELIGLTRLSGGPLSVRTLYIGGGTPTVLSVEEWIRLMDLLDRYIDRGSIEEFSVEANPESLSDGHLRFWRDRGISRISIGVQSLDDDELRWLGRLHDSNEARRAVMASVASGFDVSGDLMFGLKGQTLRKWHRSLKALAELGVGHMSLYQLTLDNDSFWGKKPPEGVFDGYGHYRWAQWYLPRIGFDQYEIASFALEGRWSLHNLAYWNRENVLGLGPGAWGYLNGLRYENDPSLAGYCDSVRSSGFAAVYSERIGGVAEASESAILALRTKWGIDLDGFCRRFGSGSKARLLKCLSEIPDNCLEWKKGSVALTRKGMRVANSIWERLLWEE